MNKYRQANRSTKVINYEATRIVRGNPQFPPTDTFVSNPIFDDCSEAWEVFVTTQTGLSQKRTDLFYFFSEEEERKFSIKYSIGSEIGNKVYMPFIEGEGKINEEDLNQYLGEIVIGEGDFDSPLAWDALVEAGLYPYFEDDWAEVVGFVGKDEVARLEEKYDENANIVATLLFCLNRLPLSSVATVAALYLYHFYVSRNDFAAGYYWRDLEYLMNGVEASALKSLETRKKAGASGSAKSRKARDSRIISLLSEIEDFAKRNPDYRELDEAALAQAALKRLQKNAPKVWSQGAGQISEYLGKIRRGEAGPELKARYVALFGDKPPRRLHGFRGKA